MDTSQHNDDFDPDDYPLWRTAIYIAVLIVVLVINWAMSLPAGTPA